MKTKLSAVIISAAILLVFCSKGNACTPTYPPTAYIEAGPTIIIAGGIVVEYQYDALSRKTFASYGNGSYISYRYDIANKIKDVNNCFGTNGSIRYGYPDYDKVGNRLNMKVNGSEHSYDYDKFGRLQSVSYPSTGGTITYAYDGFSRRTRSTDNRNDANNIGGSSMITYDYDPLGQIIDVTDQDGFHTKYSYRGDGQKAEIMVAKPGLFGNTIYHVRYDYDMAGRLKAVREPLLGYLNDYITGFTYDNNGNRSQLAHYLKGGTSGNTAAIDYIYNHDNLLTGYSSSGSAPVFELDSVTVDGLGRLKAGTETLTRTSGSTKTHNLTFAYDMCSQLTAADNSNINGSAWSADFAYLRNGNVDSRVIQGATNNFIYNGDQMTDYGNSQPPSGLVGHWKMDDNAANTTVDDSAGTNDGTAYQNTNNLHTSGKVDDALLFDNDDYVTISNPISALQSGSVTVAAWIYMTEATDAAVITQANGSDNGYSLFITSDGSSYFVFYPIGGDYCYAASEIVKVPLNQWCHIAATNDGSKLRIYLNGTKTGEDNSPGTTGGVSVDPVIGHLGDWVFNGKIDNVMVFNRALTADEIRKLYSPLDYDKNGNMITGVETSLVYNWDNKLSAASKGSDSIALKYDPDGNRIYKESTVSGQTTKRKYIVDRVGDLPTILLELDPLSNFAIKKTYIYGNSQILAQHDGSYTAPRYFYLHDRLGSVRQVINSSGAVVCRYTYNPFGEMHLTETEDNSALLNPFKYTGQYFDSETGLYYLRARQYDPYLGRFTAYDPINGKFTEPLSLHKYLYCWNDPVNYVDPWGNWAIAIGGSVTANLGGLSEMIPELNRTMGIMTGAMFRDSIIRSLLLETYSDLIGGVGGTAGAASVFGYGEQEGWFVGSMFYAATGLQYGPDFIASAQVNYSISPNAQRLRDLEGNFYEVGLSGWFLDKWGFSVSKGLDNDIYLYTGSLGVGIGKGGEAHGFVGHTWVADW